MQAARARHGSGLGRPFWLVWVAAVVSFLGDGVTEGALPLLAMSLTSDARLIAAAPAVMMLGWLILGLIAGVVVDRVDRLRVMSAADALRTLLMAALALAVLVGVLRISLLLALAFALGLAGPFFDNASSAVMPELVPTSRLARANSLIQVPLSVSTLLLGPPLGALLFVAAHPLPFMCDAVSFAVSALMLWRLARTRSIRAEDSERADAGVRAMLVEGGRYLLRHRVLRSLAIGVGVVNAAIDGVFYVLVLYVTRALHLPAVTFGWLLATVAVGTLVGAPLGERLLRLAGFRVIVIGCLFAFAVLMVTLGSAPRLAVTIPALVVLGFFSALWNVTTISYRQQTVPRELLGRVTSCYRLIAFLGVPVGSIAAGALTNVVGAPQTYQIAGLVLLLTTCVLVPALRRLPGRTQVTA